MDDFSQDPVYVDDLCQVDFKDQCTLESGEGVAKMKLPDSRTSSGSGSISLESLSVEDVCYLLDHSQLSAITGVASNILATGVESVEDLKEFGIKSIFAQSLFKHILKWKAVGVPADIFYRRDAALSQVSSTTEQTSENTISVNDGVTKEEGNNESHSMIGVGQQDDNAKDGAIVSKKESDAFKLAAEQGNASAQYHLGECYGNGAGVTKDEKEAARYYKLAADQNHAGAQHALGKCYANGTGLSKYEREAVRYFKLAADQGHAGAQFALGVCYGNATGLTLDAKEAVRYFKLAVDQGNADAQHALGFCYAKGFGVSKDEKEAVRYYNLAADQNHAGAQYKLGECCVKGEGVPKNKFQAAKWYMLAANQDHKEAIAKFNWLN